jgi:hypothetical protein
MNLSEKIQKIRTEPESVRLRYVWGCVFISMLIIIIIWILSVSLLFKQQQGTTDNLNFEKIKNDINSIKKTSPSLEDLSKDNILPEN